MPNLFLDWLLTQISGKETCSRNFAIESYCLIQSLVIVACYLMQIGVCLQNPQLYIYIFFIFWSNVDLIYWNLSQKAVSVVLTPALNLFTAVLTVSCFCSLHLPVSMQPIIWRKKHNYKLPFFYGILSVINNWNNDLLVNIISMFRCRLTWKSL